MDEKDDVKRNEACEKVSEKVVRVKYEKPTIAKFELEEIELIAGSADGRSGMGMCKYTYA